MGTLWSLDNRTEVCMMKRGEKKKWICGMLVFHEHELPRYLDITCSIFRPSATTLKSGYVKHSSTQVLRRDHKVLRH